MHILPLTTIVFLASISLAHARYICTSVADSDSYPYCISIPDKMPSDNCGGALPLVIYLGGSGTKGTGTDVTTKVSLCL